MHGSSISRADKAAATIDAVIEKADAITHSFAEFGAARPDATPQHYVEYGTGPFISINW
jgi:hypothetical protein